MENHLANYEKVYLKVFGYLKLSYLIRLLYATEMKKSCSQDERI